MPKPYLIDNVGALDALTTFLNTSLLFIVKLALNAKQTTIFVHAIQNSLLRAIGYKTRKPLRNL